jgi:flagellin
MANIGTTTAFYKVEASLSKANTEVSKSMERLATGRQNANAGDRSSYVAMADTFRLDYVGTKAGIKGASVVKGYLETAMATLDAASSLLTRLQELAILGANDTNTTADSNAIDAEAEAIADELHRLLTTSTYKGKDVFVDSAGSELIALGGRSAEMTFGVQRIDHDSLYDYNNSAVTDTVADGELYEVKDATGLTDVEKQQIVDASNLTSAAQVITGAKFTTNSNTGTSVNGKISLNVRTGTNAYNTDALSAGHIMKVTNNLTSAASAGMADTDVLTAKVEAVQALVNTARVQAGSQYAAIESAVNYTTDLTAQYELGFNTVNDVNFSMETAHLAKNQILQQAATAMLAQANMGQQSLLQLIQG